jgi:phosphoribosylformylglycinamidine cyclo-ligase
MPGFYKTGEYDLAGFAVGVVDKHRVIDGKRVRAGDVVLGLPSSGLHSNGYSLVRKVFTERELKKRWKEFLVPTTIYVKALEPLLRRRKPILKALAHITGGGFIENIPRVIPKGLQVRITQGRWPIPPLFHEIQERAKLPGVEMFRTFNMGIGLVLVVSPKDVPDVERHLRPVYPIGVVEHGSRGIRFV